MHDGDSLTKTWKVCTKVASHLEQGQRLENLSWRLWHLHNIMVESDNAKSKREFKKLSRNMGDKLDREKGKNIEELRAPGYKRTQSSDKMRRRAEEIERLREGAAHSGGIRRMQFTFSLDNSIPNGQPTMTSTTTTTTANATATTTSAAAATTTLAKPKLSISPIPTKKQQQQQPTFKEPAPKVDSNLNFTHNKGASATAQKEQQQRCHVQSPNGHGSPHDQDQIMNEATTINENNAPTASSEDPLSPSSSLQYPQQASVRLPSIFSSNFGPTALLYPSPTLAPSQTYGEDVPMTYIGELSPESGFGISRPTIELPLDELLDVEGDSPSPWEEVLASIDALQAAQVVEEEQAISKKDQSSTKASSGSNSPININDNSNEPNETTTTSTLLPSKREIVEPKTVFDSSFEMAKWIEAENTRLAAAASAKALAAQKQAAADAAKAQQQQQQQQSASSSSFTSSTSYSSRRSSVSSRQRQSSISSSPTKATTLNPKSLMNYPSSSGDAPSSNGKSSGSGNSSSTTTKAASVPATVVPISTPAGTKTECSNCGATHTPLWRRGLNDELNCNACGLYCKLHKRPRPKTMRAQSGETGRGGGSHHTHSRSVDTEVVGGAGQPMLIDESTDPSTLAKCFNCHTTATPLWRKDDEGKTVCNACGLYYKLHGSNRPLSMKSDVVRKRSRHELKRAGLVRSSSEIPSASPGASRRASPVRVPSPQPTTAAEDEDDQVQEEQKTPQFSYDYTSSSSSRTDFGTKESSNANDTLLSSTISQDQEATPNDSSNSNGSSGGSNNNINNNSNKSNGTTSSNFPFSMPGPYHPDYLYQYASSFSDLTPIQTSPNGESSGYSIEDRGNKRRRLSSASHDSSSPPTDPPPSATSINSSNRSPGASPTFSVYSLPFASIYGSYDGYENMSWEKRHPPMVIPDEVTPNFHPPMAFASESPASSSANSFIHPPMLPSEDVTMSYYNIHPPMLPPDHSPTGFNNQNMPNNNFMNRDDPNNMFDSYSIYNDATNSIKEMFETMMQPMD